MLFISGRCFDCCRCHHYRHSYCLIIMYTSHAWFPCDSMLAPLFTCTAVTPFTDLSVSPASRTWYPTSRALIHLQEFLPCYANCWRPYQTLWHVASRSVVGGIPIIIIVIIIIIIIIIIIGVFLRLQGSTFSVRSRCGKHVSDGPQVCRTGVAASTIQRMCQLELKHLTPDGVNDAWRRCVDVTRADVNTLCGACRRRFGQSRVRSHNDDANTMMMTMLINDDVYCGDGDDDRILLCLQVAGGCADCGWTATTLALLLSVLVESTCAIPHRQVTCSSL